MEGLEMVGTRSSDVWRIAGHSSPTCAESSFRQLDDAFLQTQTRIWLGEVLQLRLDDQISISEVLADGELLFEVSKLVWSLLLERHTELRHEKAYQNEPFASKKTSGRYMPYSNVDSFLKICKILGLTGIDLFSPSDVVEKRNTRRVCMCIRSFSKKARSQDLNFPDFDVVTYTVAMPTDMVGFIRRSLELSQNCLLGVSTLHDGARKKFWEDFVLAQRSGAEVCDNLEFGNMTLQHEGLISDHANDTLSCVNSSSEALMLSPILINDDGGSSQFESDARREDKNAHLESICRIFSEHQEEDNGVSRSSSSSFYSSTSSKSGASPADAVNVFGEENGPPGFSNADPDLECSSPILKHEMNDSDPVGGFISPNTVISRSTDSSHFLSDGESSMCYVHESASSCGSNSTARTINIGKGLNSVVNNMEVQFASAMSAVSGDVLSPKEYFEVNDGIQDIHFLEPENVYDSLDGKNSNYKIKCGTLAGSLPDENFVHVGHGDGEVQFSCITSLHCPDHEFLGTDCQGDVGSYEIGLVLSQVTSSAANKDETYQTDSYAVEDVGCVEIKKLPCHSPSNFCKSDDKGQHSVNLVRNGTDDHNGWNLTCISSNISSCDAMSSTVLEHGIETSDTDDSKYPKNYDLATLVESGMDCDLPHASSNAKGTECCSKFCTVHANDFSGFQQVIGCRKVGPDTINEVAVSFKQLKRTASMESCLTDKSSESISQSSHPSFPDYDSTVYHAEYEIKDGTSLENVASNNDSEERVNTSTKTSQHKSHKKLILKSVLGGSAVFGLIFLLLRDRQSNERSVSKEKTGETSIRPNDMDKVKGSSRLSSKKAQKEITAKANGVYPAEKLKFGFYK